MVLVISVFGVQRNGFGGYPVAVRLLTLNFYYKIPLIGIACNVAAPHCNKFGIESFSGPYHIVDIRAAVIIHSGPVAVKNIAEAGIAENIGVEVIYTEIALCFLTQSAVYKVIAVVFLVIIVLYCRIFNTVNIKQIVAGIRPYRFARS